MTALISNIGIEKYDDESRPELILLTFTNGDKLTYQRSNEQYSRTVSQKKKNISYTEPTFDLVEQKIEEHTFDALFKDYGRQLSTLEEQHKVAYDDAERLCAKEKEELDEFCKRQQEVIEGKWKKRDKALLEKYQSLKNKLNAHMEMLRDPSKKLKIMLGWLRESKVSAFVKAASILEADSEYIIKRISSPDIKLDGFLSHVQKVSADVCRNIKDTLQKEGMTFWYDRAADRLDNYGMIDGVVDSRLFTLVLTKEYFGRPYCVFEYCLAALAEKPIITICESDPRYGGGPVGAFELPKLSKHILKHELIEINRGYWDSFITKLSTRMQNTLNPVPGIMMKKPLSTTENISPILKEEEINWLCAELGKEGRVMGNRLLKTSKDGISVEKFRENCDNKGATLTVVETTEGDVFGGFTSRSWDRNCKGRFYPSESAWLFKLRVGASVNMERIEIKASQQAFSVFDGTFNDLLYGPIFGGGHDINISPGVSDKECYCLGPVSYWNGILSKSKKKTYFKPKDCEVFRILSSANWV